MYTAEQSLPEKLRSAAVHPARLQGGTWGNLPGPVVIPVFLDRALLRRRRFSVVVAAVILLLALVETVNAFVAPSRAPTDRDWAAAAAKVRAGFLPGDLIVAAPAWSDPLMRQQLGDLVPMPVAGRMDAARYARIWEISQRGALAADTAGATLAESSRHGALTLRRWQKPAAQVTFDFLAEWHRATVSVVNSDGAEVPCGATENRFQCLGGMVLKPELLEIDFTLRNGLGVEPTERATLAVEYPEITFGRELAVASGLHSVWLRKLGDGKVHLRVLVDGRELGAVGATSSSGWGLKTFDTSALAGKTGKVRFEITVDKSNGRHFGFAAEARNP